MRGTDRLARERAEVAEPSTTAEKHERDDDDDRDEPSTAAELERDPTRETAAAPTVVLDLRRIELRILAEPHGANLPRMRGRNPRERVGHGDAISLPARAPARRRRLPAAAGRGREP